MASTYFPQDARLTDQLERKLIRELALQEDRFNPFFDALESVRKGAIELYEFFREVSKEIRAARTSPVYIGR